MIKVHKKIISSAFVGLAVLGIAVQCSEVSAQALGKEVVQEERGASRKQVKDEKVKKEIESYISKKSDKYKFVKDYFDGDVNNINVDSLADFISKESGLKKGNYQVHVGALEIHIKVLK